MPPEEAQFSGLEWVQKMVGLEPRWTVEPDLDALKQTVASVQPSLATELQVAFFAQGAFNKLYQVQAGKTTLVMRLSLPVYPHYKTLSEVATISWVQRQTTLPVPKVVSHQATRDNPVGFEWIIMTKLPGKHLADSWRSLAWPAKRRIVSQFADSSAHLFRNQLAGIGNLYLQPASDDEGANYRLGRIVSMQFFWGDHIHQDVCRGPFRSSKDWMAARLSLNEHDCYSTLEKYQDREDLDSNNEDDLEDATRTLQIINRLRLLMGSVLGEGGEIEEPTMIFHDDLSRHNILVDDSGALTGVVDWECVSALPLWKACYYPAFLQGYPRSTEPDQGKYQRGADGELSELYWEHLLEYELTMLRREFLDEMKQLEPEWIKVFESSQTKLDLDIAVQNCDNEFLARRINEWINDLTAGSQCLRSLRSRIDED